MINLLLALLAETVAPLPTEVASARRDDTLRVQMPSRAIVVAVVLAIACGSLVFYVLPIVVQVAAHLIAWTRGGAEPNVAIPHGALAALATVVGCGVALRFLGLYARGLAHVASPTSAPGTIRYTLADPRRP